MISRRDKSITIECTYKAAYPKITSKSERNVFTTTGGIHGVYTLNVTRNFARRPEIGQ